MDRFIKLAIVIIALYFGYTKGLPWIRQEFAGGGTSPLGAGNGPIGCVDLAREAQESFSDGILPFSRPGTAVAGWEDAVNLMTSQVARAQGACSCNLESCARARQALSEIDSLIAELDSAFNGEEQVPVNASRTMERIDTMLSEAQAMARHGE